MSARSLSLFLRMFINNGSVVLTPRSIAEMKLVVGGGLLSYYDPNAISNTAGIPQASFGLSWYWQTLSDGHRYIGHSGVIPGSRNWMLVNEQNSIGLIFLSNADSNVPSDRSRELHKTLEDILLPLFRCFEPDIIKSFACSRNRTPLSVSIFLLFPFFALIH
jgi:CubicO group peptidase (beta-lactamase class C family)